MTKQQIGGYEFNYECNRIRQAAASNSETILKIVEGNPGPQTLYAMLLKVAVQNQIIADAINKVEQIGAQTKKART